MSQRGTTSPTRGEHLAVGVYCRISNDPSGLRAGVERQESECRDLARARQWNVVGVYVDNDVSASSGKPRPDYERLLRDIQRGRIHGVVAWHPDRLYRRALELERLISVAEEHRVVFATVQAGEIDLATATGRMVARQLGNAARYEVELKGERQRAAARARARTGERYPAGVRCFGYDSDNITVREDEAALIREVARRYLAGESSRSIVNDLNLRGLTTSQGRAWSANTLRTLILNPRLIGKRTYRGDVVGDGPQPPILDPETFERLRAMFADPQRLALRLPQTRRYLLTGGLAVCGLCGQYLQAQPSNAGKRGYVCKRQSMSGQIGCGKIRIAADPLEEEVAAQVLARLASPLIRKRLAAASAPDGSDVDAAVLAVQAQDMEARKREAANDYADGKIDRSDWLNVRDRVDSRLAQLREAIRQASRLEVLPEPDPLKLQAWWEDASLDSRRELVATVLDHLAVGKATRLGFQGLDPDRIRWVWKV